MTSITQAEAKAKDIPMPFRKLIYHDLRKDSLAISKAKSKAMIL